MKNLRRLILILLGLTLLLVACKKDLNTIITLDDESATEENQIGFNRATINKFFKQYPDLKKYEPQLLALYQKKAWKPIWYDNNNLNSLAVLLRDKVHSIEEEGIQPPIPYQKAFDAVFQAKPTSEPKPANDFLISAMYFYYTDKVFYGFDVKTRQSLGWYLPRKTNSYVDYLDSLKANPKRLARDDNEMFGQYYRLKSVLQRYRDMQKKSDWDSIAFDPEMEPLQVGDSSEMIPRIRKRLFAWENIPTYSESQVYDAKMARAVMRYKSKIGLVPSKKISAQMLAALNVPIADRIKTIILNMERCRWIPSQITSAEQYIVINIPSYQLTYIKKGEPVLQSNVVVGKVTNQTVIFSGDMKYIVFSPYWNVPRSIVEKEIKPALEKNKNYLQEHNMERVNGRIRQKPGPSNSLGLVKFLFPNPNNIYLHDSPSKSLFERPRRAYSHGCIRVQKPLELAQTILADDERWTPEKVDSIMHGGKETWHTLKQKIPVYITYLTTWVDDAGEVHFYDDIYKRDRPLARKLFK